MRSDVHMHIRPIVQQTLSTGDHNITVLAWSEIPTFFPPRISQPQLHFYLRDRSQTLGQMSKVDQGLLTKAMVGDVAVYLYNEQLPVWSFSLRQGDRKRQLTGMSRTTLLIMHNNELET